MKILKILFYIVKYAILAIIGVFIVGFSKMCYEYSPTETFYAFMIVGAIILITIPVMYKMYNISEKAHIELAEEKRLEKERRIKREKRRQEMAYKKVLHDEIKKKDPFFFC